MNEHDNAAMEANCIEAEDAYFEARPQIDSRDRRLVFQAGFKRAWDVKAVPTLTPAVGNFGDDLPF